jgi:phage tail tape-measure protein
MSEQQSQEIDLAQELRDLGERIKTLLQVARDHPRTKEFESQVSQAMKDLGENVDRAIKSAKDDAHVKNVGAQVKQAADSFKQSGAAEDLARGLAKGVRALNEQMQRAIDDANKPTPKE